MNKHKKTYSWGDPNVIAILSRDFLEEDPSEVGGEMTDEFFAKVKVEILVNLTAFLEGCLKNVQEEVLKEAQDTATHR